MRILLSLMCCCWCGWTANAQRYPNFFHHLTPEQGLSQAINAFVYHDSRGFVWISSIDGLNRFDGLGVKVYRPDPNNPNALHDNNMQSRFFETPDGDLWFTTFTAINHYRRQTDDFEEFTVPDAGGRAVPSDYYAFHLDGTGRLWMRAGEGASGRLYTFDIHTHQPEFIGPMEGTRCFVDTMTNGRVRHIYSVFFSAKSGLFRSTLDEQERRITTRDTFFTGKGGLPNEVFCGGFVENDTTVWLAGTEFLTAFNPFRGTCRTFRPVAGKQANFWAVVPLGEGVLAVSSTTSGTWIFDGKKRQAWQNLAPEPGNPFSLLALPTQELYQDENQNLWLTHWNSGLSFGNRWKKKADNLHLTELFPELNGQAFSNFSALAEDAQGRIWCGTEGFGIFLIKDGRPAGRLSQRPDLPSESVVHLLRDHSGVMWVLTRHHVLRYDAEHDHFQTVRGSPSPQELSYLYQTPDSRRLLVGTFAGVKEVLGFDGKSPLLAPARDFDFLENTFVPWLYQDASGTWYIAENAENLVVQPPHGARLSYPFGYVKAAFESPDRRVIWLATTSGLVKMDRKTLQFTLHDETNGLPNQYLYSVLPDMAGTLWLSSNRGVFRYFPANDSLRTYGRGDGLWADEFYTNVWLRTSSGELWFGNRDVLNIIRPESLRDISALPGIQITGLKVNDQDWKGNTYIGECTVLEFPYAENTLSFEFVALEYGDPANNRLRYHLDGYDKTGVWVDVRPGSPGFARYARLPPGSYTFQVQAANSDGIWNPESHRMGVVIHAPFWQTWWFMLLVVGAVAAIAYSLYRYRLAQVRKEFGFRQKMAESEMKALRAQMNPHFIFNSLNSINAYILQNLPAQAGEYLTRFAHLMRQILDNSARETITLDNEIEFLESYLRVEAMRMEHKLSWDISLADSVDGFDTKIPSMILQPYIENAIWHGIAHRPEGGKITVAIRHDDSEALLLTVEDNGVGRTRARALRAPNGKTHESKGLKITEERLSLYDQKHGTTSTVKTTDLFDSQGNATGTRVEIRLSPNA